MDIMIKMEIKQKLTLYEVWLREQVNVAFVDEHQRSAFLWLSERELRKVRELLETNGATQ